MNPVIIVCTVLLLFSRGTAHAGETSATTLFHASFDTFDFLADELSNDPGI